MTPERVRFAPSPTGEFHVGGLRTALFNWLLARKSGGQFILRIEDTDQKRFVAGSGDRLMQTLDWLGLTPDEGPVQGGLVGPYVQSERLKLYQDTAKKLVEVGAAYWCFCTPERLTELREKQIANHEAPGYDRYCSNLPSAEVESRLKAGEPAVVRHRIPGSGQTVVHDLIHGDVVFQHATLDDYVLLKADGYPTYHLAVVADDHAMDVTLVIRAEEWLPSTPKHLLLYQALDWNPPRFAHPPQILDKNRAKLSKRHGAVTAEAFRDLGILPDALINYIALLGWNPGQDREIMSREEMINLFSIEQINKSGAIFDEEKLFWFNSQYLRQISDQELFKLANPLLTEQFGKAWTQLPNQLQIIQLVRERIRSIKEIASLISFAIALPDYPAAMLVPKKGSAEKTLEVLQAILESAQQDETFFSQPKLHEKLEHHALTHGYSRGDYFWPLRVALTGLKASPGASEVSSALTRQETIKRLTGAINKLKLPSGQ